MPFPVKAAASSRVQASSRISMQRVGWLTTLLRVLRARALYKYNFVMQYSIAVIGMVLFCATAAAAGAWTETPGHTLAILTVEPGTGASQATNQLAEQSVRLFIERGLTSRLAVELQTGGQTRSGPGVKALGPAEQAVGIKYRFAHWRRWLVSGYLGTRALFDLRNGAAPSFHPDWRAEARGLAGSSYRVLGHDAYTDIQTTVLYARPNRIQIRKDATFGLSMDRLTTLSLAFRQGDDFRQFGQTSWSTVEATGLRKFGAWQVEAGWRRTVTSNALTPVGGPIVAVWRTF